MEAQTTRPAGESRESQDVSTSLLNARSASRFPSASSLCSIWRSPQRERNRFPLRIAEPIGVSKRPMQLRILPKTGLEVVFACALQFFFAFSIFRRILGANVLGIALCGVFFLLSPPLNYRFMGQYSLSNHWVLPAALLVFLSPNKRNCGACRRPDAGAARVEQCHPAVCDFCGRVGGDISRHQSASIRTLHFRCC